MRRALLAAGDDVSMRPTSTNVITLQLSFILYLLVYLCMVLYALCRTVRT